MIEMCQEVISGKQIYDWPIHENTIVQTLLQTQAWMNKYNIPASNVIRHFDVSGKLCPAPWRHNDWALWKQFKTRLATLSGSKIVEEAAKQATNPVDTEWAAYKTPVNKFKELKVGDTITIRKGHQYWYIAETGLKRKSSKDFAGDKDEIVAVRDVNVSYSKKAYKLKAKVSWILEQDLVEATSTSGNDFDAHIVQKGDSLWAISQKYGVTVEQIKAWNNLESNVIFSGQELFVQKPTHTAKDKTAELETVVRPADENNAPETKEVKEQPKDTGVTTAAVVLKPNQVLTADGRILEFRDVTSEVKK